MPQLRKDPIIGRWVIIATERGLRPNDFKKGERPPKPKHPDSCPFCEKNEEQTQPEVFAVRRIMSRRNKPGWDVRVVPNVSPLLDAKGGVHRHAVGMYDIISGVGAHEVIVETPKHIADLRGLDLKQIEKVVKTYITRFRMLREDKGLKYVLLFKNYGWAAGGGDIEHARSQLIATPVTPKRVKEELSGARKYFEYKERCVFCDMIRQDTVDSKRIVGIDDGFITVVPFAARFPFEMWILPLEHSCDFHKMSSERSKQFAKTLKSAFTRLFNVVGDVPYNMVVHTAPFRRTARAGYWMSIERDYHWHVEIMPRLSEIAGFEWGTGFYINSMPPEDAAKFLREANHA